jgi:predicted transcriptional regulator of viral defense system
MYRISELIQQDRKLFHTTDLADIWGIANRNTLYVTITRYIDRGILYPVYKGLYSIVPLAQLDPLELGKAIINCYAYLSTESILWQAGIISQKIYDCTFVSSISKYVVVSPWLFRYRQLKAEYLHNPISIIENNGVFIASPERAVADMVYFNPRYHFETPQTIDFAKVRMIQEAIGYPHTRYQTGDKEL